MDVLWGWVIITQTKPIREQDPNTMKKVIKEWKTEKNTLNSLYVDIKAFDNDRDLDEKTTLKLGKHLKDPKRTLD